MTESNSLQWFPFSPGKWKARTAALSIDARGAYFALRIAAWEATDRGQPPCSLPDDDVQLARLSGYDKRWPKIAAEVRALLEVVDEGLLVDTDLLTTWTDQHSRYQRRADAGARGGKAKASAEQSSSNATANGKHIEREKEREKKKKERVTPSGVSLARPPAESWVAEGVALWESIVGTVAHGEFGKALKPMIVLHGWPAVRPDLEKWLRDRAANGKPCRPSWYAGEVTARLAPKPRIVDDDGNLTEYGERITRPDKVPA